MTHGRGAPAADETMEVNLICQKKFRTVPNVSICVIVAMPSIVGDYANIPIITILYILGHVGKVSLFRLLVLRHRLVGAL